MESPSIAWHLEPIGWPARLLPVAVLVVVASCVWSFFGMGNELAMLRGDGVITWHATGNMSVVYRALAGTMVVSLLMAFIFVMWLRRAWRNVARRGLGGSSWHARTSFAWWWLVPVVNFAAPLHVMATLWRGSQDPTDLPGSTAWASRPVPVALVVWWLGQVATVVLIGLLVWRQPAFEEAWSCVWNPVRQQAQDCVLTPAGRAAWLRSDVALAVMFVAQVALGLLFYRIVGQLNAMQARLVAAYSAVRREDLWVSLRQA